MSVDISDSIKCPSCKTAGINNFNMIINITTEQPLKYFKQMPASIELSPDTSANPAWIDWKGVSSSIICRECNYSSTDPKDFSI